MRRISVVAKGIKTVYLDDPRGKNARLSRSVAHQCAVSPFYRRVFASLIVSLCVASGVAGAVSDCEKELPIADTIGQFPWADKTYSTPTDMLRDACPEGHPLIESTVRMWDTPTREQPYPQWLGICYRPPTNPKPESPVCVPPVYPDLYWCGGYDGSESTAASIRMNAPVCDGKLVGRLMCGGGDGFLRCPSVAPDKNISNCGVGNPINCTIGNKHQREEDIADGDSLLDFIRTYNSMRPSGAARKFFSDIGPNWRHSFSSAVVRLDGVTPTQYVTVMRPNGQSFQFTFDTTSGLWETTPEITHRLAHRVDAQNNVIGFEFHEGESDRVEIYDLDGRLLSITDRSGRSVSLEYDDAGLKKATDSFGRSLAFHHEAGLLKQVTDSNGEPLQYEYDTTGNLVNVTYPGGIQRQYRYNEAPHTSGVDQPTALTGITDEAGVQFATFEYDSTGRATVTEHAGETNKFIVGYPYNSAVVTGPLGETSTRGFETYSGTIKIASRSQSATDGSPAATTYSHFDNNGNVIWHGDFNGNQTVYTYDLARNLETSRTEAYGTSRARTITTSWHTTYRLPTSISVYAGGSATGIPVVTTSLTYDPAGNLLNRTLTDPANSTSRTWAYTYNSFGRVLTAEGPRTDVGDVTTYAYYNCATGFECGQVQTVTDALGHVTTFNSYNAAGQPLTLTDQNGVVTTLTYDARHRMTARVVGTEVTLFSYFPTGLLQQVTMPDGSFLQYTYDDAHRLTGIQDADGNRIVYTLDTAGNRTAENLYDPSTALSHTHTRVFNSLSKLYRDINANNTAAVTTNFAYDGNGNQTSANAPLGRNSANVFDELSRLTQVTDPGNGVTHYSYDTNDNLIAVTDPRNLQTTYAYNAFRDLTQQISPDTGITMNTFDSGGNLKTSTDARNRTATYTYDALNRVTQVAFGDQTITYGYDAGANGVGRLTSSSDANHSLSWSYDSLGRITGKTQVVGSVTKSVSYAYTNGQLSSMTTPSGQTIAYTYTNGKLTGMSVNGTSLLTSALYEPFGPIRGWNWGNGTVAVRTIDTDGNVTQVDSAGLNTYSYDDAFRITGSTDAGNSAHSWNYGYDNLDRLTTANNSALTQGFTYDADGNRRSQTGSTGTTLIYPTTSNQLTGVTGALTRTYLYDNAGNITSDGSNTFTYNNAGRLTSVTNTGGTTSYAINALGQRVSKSSSTATTYFVYDEAGHLAGEYDNTGNLIQEIVWLGDIPVATIRTDQTGGSVGVFYIHTDHLNAPAKITRPADNQVIWRWDHDPFGNGVPNEDPDGNGLLLEFNLAFPGQYRDKETGLSYNYLRDYDPQTGRYVESDPIGLHGGLNTYAYAMNDPLDFIDPYGLARTTVDAAIEQAIRRGDIGELETLMEASNPEQAAVVRAALDRLKSKARDIIAKECKGSINREFPDELRERTLKEIMDQAKGGDSTARKALKLLNDSRFKK